MFRSITENGHAGCRILTKNIHVGAHEYSSIASEHSLDLEVHYGSFARERGRAPVSSSSRSICTQGGLLHSVQTALKKGDKVTLTGFGTSSVSKRAARTGRNPQTGEPIMIKATKAPRFKPGAELKAAVQK
jgi:DNA-binding protein HU-beta